ncbi:protein suppressor of white apricot isoform X2 [Lutzomyia longipalpis]|nr:protein suppressor of white apricot isoform X2 [Lutzomyia longipalpis]XP_055693506.1 protein suppressor of white apricot isoform X2 [Lutzomyia longipalpis]
MYEPPPGGYTNRLDYLSPAEQKAEQLCEEERYYSLYHNEREEEYQQEEELKRIQTSSYAQVNFSYDTPPSAVLPEKQPSVEEEEEETFEPLPNFPIPADIELPPTVKLNAIIEKTARFIASQGAQMEILIKTKQANNPQFEFLTQNGRFNGYYKFILAAIKENRYPSPETEAKATDEIGEEGSGERRDVPKVPQEQYGGHGSQKIMPVIKYKPSADCAYTQLISKITGAPLPAQMDEDPEVPDIVPPEPVVSKPSTSNGSSVVIQKPPQLADNERVDFKRKAESVEVKKISTGLMLAQCYNSDSEEDEDSNSGNSLFKLDLPVPPDGLQHIIDKTAAYVAKNGKDFEDILRTKQDPRFSFLDESSEYHRYYIYKVTGSIYLPSTSVSNGDTQPKKEEPETSPKDDGTTKIVTPVCFSIKAKDDPPVPMKPVLPQEPSSDEEGAEKNGSNQVQEVKESSVEERSDSGDTNRDLGINVEEILEMEEKKEAKRAEEKVRDKLAAAAREKLGLISKEKQLQLERKKKAMAFLTQIKSSGGLLKQPQPNATVTVTVPLTTAKQTSSSVENGQEGDSDTDVSIHSLPTATDVPHERSRSRSRSSRKRRTRSRSRTRSTSGSSSRSSRRRSVSVKRKKKKSKHERSKKKSKRKSRSRSSERKHKKKSSRRRSEERHR